MAQDDLLSSALRAVRRARNVPQLLRRAPLFRERGRFVRHEIGHVRLALPYTLRSSGLKIYLRHHSTDVGALNEVFLDQLYRFPEPVRARLDGLGRSPAVLDLGAHVGMFGVWFLGHYPGATITAVEADPLNAVMLRRAIRANERLDTWQVFDAAASNAPGRAVFAAGRGAASTMIGADTAEGAIEVEVIDAFELFRDVDLVKMDIEGAEWPILLDERLRTAPLDMLVLEYHPWGCPGAHARTTAEELLRAAGFELSHVADQGGGMGMLWAWRDSAASA